jgi:uncharacterized protein (TIGR03435 family)
MGPLFFDTEHTSLKELIAVAFKLEASQINGGPKWIDSDRFDVHAKAEAASSPEEIRAMLRELLRERFHPETRAAHALTPVYA